MILKLLANTHRHPIVSMCMDSRGAVAAALLLVASVGCDMNPEGSLAGAWTVDGNRTKLPDAPFPGATRRLRNGLNGTVLKLRPDRSFGLVLFDRTSDGTWNLKGDVLTLRPKAGDPVEIHLAGGHEEGVLLRETPLGEVRILLKKTG